MFNIREINKAVDKIYRKATVFYPGLKKLDYDIATHVIRRIVSESGVKFTEKVVNAYIIGIQITFEDNSLGDLARSVDISEYPNFKEYLDIFSEPKLNDKELAMLHAAWQKDIITSFKAIVFFAKDFVTFAREEMEFLKANGGKDNDGSTF